MNQTVSTGNEEKCFSCYITQSHPEGFSALGFGPTTRTLRAKQRKRLNTLSYNLFYLPYDCYFLLSLDSIAENSYSYCK